MSDSEEEFVDEEEAEGGAAAVKKLRERLATAVKEKQEYLDGWQRMRADFANYKREEAAASGEKEVRMRAECIESLLPALDTLDMALRHDKENNPILPVLQKQFGEVLKTMNVEQFGEAGDAFSPHRYEALSQAPVTEEAKDHTVVEVFRKGYSIGDTVIRPAQVVVGVYTK